jgi:hypothetical protein
MNVSASVRRCVGASLPLAALLVSCLDPRARPATPEVAIQFSGSFRLTSPGQILGVLHLADTDGLSSVRLSLVSDDSTFVGDSLIGLSGDPEVTRPINWTVPAGLATGTFVTIAATARDFGNFITADTVKVQVQDPLPGVR